jgi:hypothetical protein
MFIDPIIISWLLLAAASFAAFMIGMSYNNSKKEEVIENTILWLIDNNMINAKKVNGEWEILELDEN